MTSSTTSTASSSNLEFTKPQGFLSTLDMPASIRSIHQAMCPDWDLPDCFTKPSKNPLISQLQAYLDAAKSLEVAEPESTLARALAFPIGDSGFSLLMGFYRNPLSASESAEKPATRKPRFGQYKEDGLLNAQAIHYWVLNTERYVDAYSLSPCSPSNPYVAVWAR